MFPSCLILGRLGYGQSMFSVGMPFVNAFICDFSSFYFLSAIWWRRYSYSYWHSTNILSGYILTLQSFLGYSYIFDKENIMNLRCVVCLGAGKKYYLPCPDTYTKMSWMYSLHLCHWWYLYVLVHCHKMSRLADAKNFGKPNLISSRNKPTKALK